MLFRPTNIARFSRQAQFEMKNNGVDHLYLLSNGLLLYVGQLVDDNTAILTLFNPKTKAKVAERIMVSRMARVIPLDDDSFLLKTEYDDKLHILSAKNLETRENLQETISNFDTCCHISNNRFLSIHEENKTDATQLTLMNHDCRKKQFNQKVSFPVLIKHKDTEISYTGDLIKLDNGQIAFKVLGHNTEYFTVFVFDKKYDNEFSLSHILRPKRYPSNGSCASGKVVALTNGRLLTYHSAGKHFQIWEGKNCVKEWSWSDEDIRCSVRLFSNWTNDVAALPDGDHLLVKMGVKLFLFNMATSQLQSVEIGKLEVFSFCIYPNGQTIINGKNKDYSKTTLLTIDFACIADYRKGISTSLSQAIGRDPGSIVNGYLGHDKLYARDETSNNSNGSMIRQCIIS